MDKNRVIIFDTTLRDGEQAPGCSMNLREKLAVAHQLARLGADVIEAGFPISSPGDFESVKRIADEVKGPIICGLSRATEKDIKACGEALAGAEKKRIHVFIATSPVHMKNKLNKTPEEVLEAAVKAVKYAKTFTDDVEFSCEDASRSDIEFLQKISEACIEAGATTINLPDTVGYMMPWEYGEMIKSVISGVSNADKAIFSVHCHNDLGMAVANSIAAVINGARQVEVSINGIGERAGNAALEEIAMAIKTKEKLMHLTTGINTKEIYNACRLVSRTTNMPIPANKAIVGQNAFLHESGIHQDGVLKDRSTYEIMDPADIGIKVDNIVLGKHSGRHAFKTRLANLGYRLEENEIGEVFESFKKLCDQKKEIMDEDLVALVLDKTLIEEEHYRFHHIHIFSGTDLTATATLGVELEDGTIEEVVGLGKGPIDAAYAAVDSYFDKILPAPLDLMEYRIGAITPGQDAQGEVGVKLVYEGTTVHGKGISINILEASTKAYMNAINRLINIKKERQM